MSIKYNKTITENAAEERVSGDRELGKKCACLLGAAYGTYTIYFLYGTKQVKKTL